MKRNYRKAFLIYKELFDQMYGDKYDITEKLVECYEFGRGTEIDYEKAFELCERLYSTDTCEYDRPADWEPPCAEMYHRVLNKLQEQKSGLQPGKSGE